VLHLPAGELTFAVGFKGGTEGVVVKIQKLPGGLGVNRFFLL
jgi:hypothetical protein